MGWNNQKTQASERKDTPPTGHKGITLQPSTPHKQTKFTIIYMSINVKHMSIQILKNVNTKVNKNK